MHYTQPNQEENVLLEAILAMKTQCARSSQGDVMCQKQVRWLLCEQKDYQHSKVYQTLWYATAGVPDREVREGKGTIHKGYSSAVCSYL